MTILPVYTTSKLHAARINLGQTPSSTPGRGIVQLRKGRGRGLQNFSRTRKRARPYNPPFMKS